MRLREAVAHIRTHAARRIRDARDNRRLATGEERFLVVRHPRAFGLAYESALLTWLEQHAPEVRARFELRLLPCRVRDWSPYRLHLPWLQDPVQGWSESTYRRAERLAVECDRRGIPIVNRVDRLPNAGKLEGARRIASAGLRTPRSARIEDVEKFRDDRLGLDLPLIVREDWGHGRRALLVSSDEELRAVRLEPFERPIAVEFVDVRTAGDGLVRKYRVLAAGDLVLPLSMHVCESWRTSGSEHVIRPELMEEEHDFASRATEHAAAFRRAREALGLDLVAFDYGRDGTGAPVVWEANPYPHIRLSTGRGAYRAAAVVRALAATTHLVLRSAALAVPSKVEDLLAHPAIHGG